MEYFVISGDENYQKIDRKFKATGDTALNVLTNLLTKEEDISPSELRKHLEFAYHVKTKYGSVLVWAEEGPFFIIADNEERAMEVYRLEFEGSAWGTGEESEYDD